MWVWLLILTIWVSGLTYMHLRIFFALRQDKPKPLNPVIIDDAWYSKIEQQQSAQDN